MLKALGNALLPLLLSKKFQLAALATLSQLAAHYGLGFSAEAALALVSPLIAGVLGQAIADHGVEAAKINAASAKASS